MEFVYLLLLVFGTSTIVRIPRADCATYYVKPSPSTACPDTGQTCETLQYYVDTWMSMGRNVSITNDVTMIFLNGLHLLNGTNTLMATINIYSSVNVTGEGNVTIQCLTTVSLYDECFFSIILNHGAELYIHQFALQTVYSFIVGSKDHELLQITSVELSESSLVTRQIQTVLIENFTTHKSGVEAVKTHVQFKNSVFSRLGYTYLYENSRAILQNCSFFENQFTLINADVQLENNNTFAGTPGSAVKCYQGNISMTGEALFMNNTGTRGAALALYSCMLYISAGINLTFAHNSAKDKGGAMYIEPSLSPFLFFLRPNKTKPRCFFDCNHPLGSSNDYNVNFFNNSAALGGDDMYGASFNGSYCEHNDCTVTVNGASSNISSVSSDPTRVCLCDSQGRPQCSNTNISDHQLTSGENLTLMLVAVGEHFGTTSGGVIAGFLTYETIATFKPGTSTPLDSKMCTAVNYSFFSNHTYGNAIMYLSAVNSNLFFSTFYNLGDPNLASVKLNITIVPCPPGFFLVGDPPACNCYQQPCNTHIECIIASGNGLFAWNGSLWIGFDTEEKLTCNQYCPVDYCNMTGDWMNIHSRPDAQCAYNRAGRLCGGCRDNYSLAIGSSHCIHCPNNSNLALIIFFAIAGLLLVLFITALNLTVSQNAINELIFYANVVWIYQNTFFPSGQQTSTTMVFLKTFIAWINLDFGIETCFVRGLNAFWKTWLQFVFPFYIWSIVGLIIFAARHSTRFTRLLPSRRTIPVLCTVFLLSYMKLVGITSSALKFSFTTAYPNDTIENLTPQISTVWSLDGNLSYCGHPHILLFLAGLGTLLFLWLPYTLLLLLMQWLKRISHLMLLRWIQQFFPISDAYFAPLSYTHQYWFGTLLLVRGILLVINTSAFGIPSGINVMILLMFSVALLFYMNFMQVYKTAVMLAFNNTFTLNLIVLSSYFLLTYTRPDWRGSEVTAIGVSVGVVFVQFCGIVVYALVMECKSRGCCKKKLLDNEEDTQAYRPLE